MLRVFTLTHACSQNVLIRCYCKWGLRNVFFFFNVGLNIKSYCLKPIIFAKDNLKFGLTYIFPRTYYQCFPLLDWEIPCLFWRTEPPVSHWDNVEVDGPMTSMSNAKVWLDFLCHIKEVSRSFFFFFYVLIFLINLCSFGLAFLQLHGHFVLKSKTINANRRYKHFVRTSFV